MCSQNHRAIVSSVPNWQSRLCFELISNQHDNLWLLCWWNSASKKHINFLGVLCKDRSETGSSTILFFQNCIERFSWNDHCMFNIFRESNLRANVVNLPYKVLLVNFVNIMLLHLWIEKSSWVTDVNGSLNFVTCQHPNSNSSIFHKSNCVSNFILELILDSCGTNQFKALLNFFINFSNLVLSVNLSQFGYVLLFLPDLVLLHW